MSQPIARQPIAGPSNPHKRTRASTSAAPSESFGALDLADDGENVEVDEDYDTTDSEDDEAFPEIHTGSYDDNEEDGSDDYDEDEEDDGLSENEQILRELAEEEELERDLADTSDSSFSDEDYDENDPDALDHAIRKATRKPDEDFDGSAGTENAVLTAEDRNKLLGFDTRAFKDKARVGRSTITGQARWTWDNIEPGWESDEGAEEGPNRVGNIPAYFYDDMPHVGYDMDGKRVARPAKGDELDKFLENIEDPASWYVNK